MPLYDFHCPNCGLDDEGLFLSRDCPNCGAVMIRKFPGNQMFMMKGEGGYPSRRRQIFNTTKRLHPKLT